MIIILQREEAKYQKVIFPNIYNAPDPQFCLGLALEKQSLFKKPGKTLWAKLSASSNNKCLLISQQLIDKMILRAVYSLYMLYIHYICIQDPGT